MLNYPRMLFPSAAQLHPKPQLALLIYICFLHAGHTKPPGPPRHRGRPYAPARRHRDPRHPASSPKPFTHSHAHPVAAAGPSGSRHLRPATAGWPVILRGMLLHPHAPALRRHGGNRTAQPPSPPRRLLPVIRKRLPITLRASQNCHLAQQETHSGSSQISHSVVGARIEGPLIARLRASRNHASHRHPAKRTLLTGLPRRAQRAQGPSKASGCRQALASRRDRA
jgi:hypothetical protein